VINYSHFWAENFAKTKVVAKGLQNKIFVKLKFSNFCKTLLIFACHKNAKSVLVGCGGSVVGCGGSVVGCGGSVVGCRGSVVGCGGSVVGCGGSVVGCGGSVS
jgi:hypothetical protein